MPACLPCSCNEDVADAVVVGSQITNAQTVTLAFPGCPSNSTEICLSFEGVHEVNCQKSSPKISIPKKNLNKVSNHTCNDLNACKEIENGLEINNEHCLSSMSDVDKAEHMTCTGAPDEAHKQYRALVQTLPMFACYSSLHAGSTAEIERDQQLSTSPGRSHQHSSSVHSSSLNWASDRKKVLDGGRDDNASSCVFIKATPRGRSLKYKSESRSFEDCGCSNAGITNSRCVLHQEFCYSSPSMEILCGESAQGDSMATQKSQNTGADDKDEVLPKEDASEIKSGNAHLDLPSSLQQEQAPDFQETIPLSLGTSKAHRSPPRFRPKSKDHRLIDTMFVDVLRLLVAADKRDTDIAPGSDFEDAMKFKDRKTLAGLNQTSNHEQQERAVASTSHTDCSTSRGSPADHNLSEEVVSESPSAGFRGSPDHCQLNMLHSWQDDDDEYECLCCKVKNQYCNQDNNNCHCVYEDENSEECSGRWECLHSASTSGGSSRESLRSNEGDNPNVQRTQSSETRTSRRPSVRELVRSLQEKFSACTNPRPLGKQSMDTLPEWQFTSYNVPGNASISRATSSSRQDDLPECDSSQTNTAISLGGAVYSSELSVQSGHTIKVTEPDKPEKSEHSDKVRYSESSDSSALIKVSRGLPSVRNLIREAKIPNESSENLPGNVSVTRETFTSSDSHTTLFDEENETCCPMKQFLQRTDQSVVVSRTGMLFQRSPALDERPRTSQDTTGSSYLHGQTSLFTISDSRSTGQSTPDSAQHFRNSNDNPQYEQSSQERQHCFEHAHPGTSVDMDDKCLHRDKRWNSLLGGSTCLDKVKATISRVRSKSVSPLITKLSSVFEKIKDPHVQANKSLSLSGILEESSTENIHLQASSKRLFDSSCMVTTLLQHEGLSTRGSQTTNEPDIQSVHPVHTTSSTTSGDDHPPIFCLEINRTASVRKSDKQQSRHQKCCTVTRDSKYTDSLNSSHYMERNELSRIQQAVVFTNLDAVKEWTNHSPPLNKEISKSFTKESDMLTSKGRSHDDFVIESTLFLKEGNTAQLSSSDEIQISPESPGRLSSITPMVENKYICEDLRVEDTLLGRLQQSEVDLDADVESYCVKELFGVLEIRVNSPGDLNPLIRPSSTPTNHEGELTGVSLSNGLSASAPEKSCSWGNACEATHTESCFTEVMAIVSDKVHITRYPSFIDLTNLNSDVSVAMPTILSEADDHDFLNQEVLNNVVAQNDASETINLTDQSNDLFLKTATIFNATKCKDASNLEGAYLNGSPVEIGKNEIVGNCVESGCSKHGNGELATNSQADIHRVAINSTLGNMDTNSGVIEPGHSVVSLAGLQDCEMFNVHQAHTDLSPLISSVEIEQRAADDDPKDGFIPLSPLCRSVSDNNPSCDTFGNHVDNRISRPELGVMNKIDFQSVDLPSPPDHSISDISWDNDVLDTQTDQSVNDIHVSVTDRPLLQSTSKHMRIMSASPVHDKRLELLRAAVTQNYSPLSEDFSLGPTSFGASSDSCSSEEKQFLSDRHIQPIVYSHREDSQSSEVSISSLTCTDSPKELQEADNWHLYVVDIFRDFRIDSEQPSANGNSHTEVKKNESTSLRNPDLEPNTTSEWHQDCQFNPSHPAADGKESETPAGFGQMIASNVAFEKGSGFVAGNSEDVSTSKLSVSSAAEQQGGGPSDKQCTRSVCAESNDSLLHDNDNWNTLISRTYPKTIEKVIKTQSHLPSLCTISPGAASEHDETTCSDEAEEKLNKQKKKIRWLDNVNCISIAQSDSVHPNVFSESYCSGHCSNVGSENTTSQIDTSLDHLDDTDMSSSGTTKGNSSK